MQIKNLATMPWTITNINSWKELTDFFEETKAHESTLPHWIFRGQADKSWTLMPSLLRKIQQYNFSQKKALGIENNVYREFITKHRLYCNHELPKSESNLSMNVFAMMQHYSCPTRLLDWTHSPYIALYFAVESLYDKDGSLYLFHESFVDKLMSRKYSRLSDFSDDDIFGSDKSNSVYSVLTMFQTERNIFQQGLFTISPNIMSDHEFAIDEILINENKNGYHHKLIIPKELKIEFLARLKSMNISADILYRNLDGLGKSLSHIIDFRGWKDI